MDGIRAWLDEEFAGLVAEYDVPGAAVAVLAGDEVAEAATGVLNTATGVAATTDSVFQLASVTKMWTTALVMQLVDEGALDLDQPVHTYLPGFRVADEHATATVTPRHLLSHTAGFDAETFTETTHGDDAIATFVDGYLPTIGQLFPARRAVLVQQRRLLPARPDRRGPARQAVPAGAPGIPGRAARPGTRRHPCRRGGPVPGLGRPRRPVRTGR